MEGITNNIAPFVSITWLQKEPLGCVVYSHCPTNDTCNVCIHSCCLPCNYVTKPFGTFQRVIRSQRVYIYHLDSAKVDIFSLRKIKADKFSEIFKFKFSGLMIKNSDHSNVQFSRKKCFLFVHMKKWYQDFLGTEW